MAVSGTLPFLAGFRDFGSASSIIGYQSLTVPLPRRRERRLGDAIMHNST